MEEQVKTYNSAGKHEAAARLQEQMILLQVNYFLPPVLYFKWLPYKQHASKKRIIHYIIFSYDYVEGERTEIQITQK